MNSKWKAFWRGFGSIIDIFGTSYDQEIEDILSKTDEEALREDCEKVKSDFETAMQRSCERKRDYD
jgi:hypothetical protein